MEASTMIHPLPRSTQSRYCSWVVYCGLFLSFIFLLPIQNQASTDALYTGKEITPNVGVVSPAQENPQTRGLEPGKPIERRLAGGESHYYAYQLTMAAGQYAKLLVEQRGIDVVVKLFAPDGKQFDEFDSERRMQGSETAYWVAEATGSYRLDVVAKLKNAAAGQYEIQVVELRLATENDRALHEARKLYTESRILYGAGKYDEARLLAERTLAIRERVLGPEHSEVAISLNILAVIYSSMGDYTRGEQFFRRAQNIWEKTLGPEHPLLANSLENLAVLYIERGKYAEAEPLLQRVRSIIEKSVGQDHPDVSLVLINIADLCYDKGDYEKAGPLYQRALAINEKAFGPENPNIVDSLSRLARFHQNIGNDVEAESLYQRALAISEKTVGPEHPAAAIILNNLAVIYRDRGDYAKAEPLFQRSITIFEKSFGPEDPNVGRAQYFLATLYRKRGDYAKAESLYQRALVITEKALEPEHPEIGIGLDDFVMLYAAKGDIAQAITFLSRAIAINERNLDLNLYSGSERQKLAYLSRISKQTNLTLSLQSQAAQNDPQALNLAFTTLLSRKGRALDAMADTIATLRRHATPEDQKLFNELIEVRSQLASLKLKDSNTGNPDTYRNRVKKLENEVDELEGELSSRSGEFRAQTQPITLAAVQAALPANSALVEFAYFMPVDPKTEKRNSPRYLAYVLAAQGQPKWVDLGESSQIDSAVDAWREALRDPNRTDVKLLARTVDEKVMRPLRALLGDTRRLLIAPDGRLNLIPFDALVDQQNQYLIERYSISYLTSGRDLLRLQSRQPSRGGPLVVANPDFGRFATIALRTDRGSGKERAQIDSNQIFFQPLPGTEDEALAIKALLPKASVLRRDQATETALKQASGPRILHIATHGFFLDNQEGASVENNPLRIGLPGTTDVLASAEANPYTVQLEATPEFETAQERVKSFTTRGLNAYIVKSEVKGKGTFFRVRAGNFRTQTEAQKYGADLQERGVVGDFFVTRYEPPQRGLIEQKSSVNDSLSNLRISKFATRVEDPLLRSGLALAGANQGKSGDDDGVLTALEAAYLDLLGTKLVVLSACDTGVGEVKNGEGVLGLRRALVLAGSESQVMSLWPVSDEAAKDLMIPYYKALQQGEGRSDALRQVQLRMLRGRKDQRHPFYWAAFIQSGEWANLDGQR
jgi:CHAT domain-containing protein